ncbi:MAG: putative DNA binding domain-containing protein [Alphaproteobacteria bacterium]|nr:putative DNA binding domain-containing protein [Alphaproteobacteria bacterium]
MNGDVIGRCVSALANSAVLAGQTKAYLVFGIEDESRMVRGTDFHPDNKKIGNESIRHWLVNRICPRLNVEFCDVRVNGKTVWVLIIEPAYDHPVAFGDARYIRIGPNNRKLQEFPEKERALWLATGRRGFEDAAAEHSQSQSQVFEKLDIPGFFELKGTPAPGNEEEIIGQIAAAELIREDGEGGYDITNLGAVLFANDMKQFPSVSRKAVRLIEYSGTSKIDMKREKEHQKGYAAGFRDLLKEVEEKIAQPEEIREGVRTTPLAYPRDAVREILVNALIHQDFSITGAGPMVEIYSDRMEIYSPGGSLIDEDRIIDDHRSRNEKLAEVARNLGLCEERGSGLDRALGKVEEMCMAPPEFLMSQNSVRVILFQVKEFRRMTKEEKARACFFHCVLRWVGNDYMNNRSLRDRFGLPEEKYQSVSAVIADSVEKNRIKRASPDQGRRYASYIPYWA